MNREEAIKADEERRQAEMVEVERGRVPVRIKDSIRWITENLADLEARYATGKITRHEYTKLRRDGTDRLQELSNELRVLKKEAKK